jgi:hypothetical protein
MFRRKLSDSVVLATCITISAAAIMALLVGIALGEEPNLAQGLQNVSATIADTAGKARGSGVLVTRQMRSKPGSEERIPVTFAWTAGHVIKDLRTTRTVIDPATGTSRTIIEFADPKILRELIQDGRTVEESRTFAAVIRYSAAEHGEDLALLRILRTGYTDLSAEFTKVEEIPVGTRLFHVGSLLGQTGANSLTDGILSQNGRIPPNEKKPLAQSTVVAFPGSSGGGIFFADGPEAGKCCGLVVRGAVGGFTLSIPVRRIQRWAQEAGVEWALYPGVEAPDLETLKTMPIEDIGVVFKKWAETAGGTIDE